jgi:hypothetical protein
LELTFVKDDNSFITMTTTLKLTETVLDAIREPLNNAFVNFLGELAEHIAKETEGDAENMRVILEKFEGSGFTFAKAKAEPKTPRGKKAPKYKYPGEPGEIVIVENYGPRSHAIFGDTEVNKATLESFNVGYKTAKGKEGKKLISYNPRLAYGAGWVITNKEKLGDIEKGLKKAKVVFKKMTVDAYKKVINFDEADAKKEEKKTEKKEEKDDKKAKKTKEETKNAEKEKTEEDNDTEKVEAPEEEEKPKSTKKGAKKGKTTDKPTEGKPTKKKAGKKTDEVKEAPPKTPAQGKPKPPAKSKKQPDTNAKENKWGNYEEEKSGVVFTTLSDKGAKVSVAIGYQDKTKPESEKGLDSVLPLTDDLKEICKKNKWRMLEDKDLQTIEKTDEDLYNALKEMLEREPTPEENNDDKSGDVEENENEDDGKEQEEDVVDDE